jgi:hypothetical protein
MEGIQLGYTNLKEVNPINMISRDQGSGEVPERYSKASSLLSVKENTQFHFIKYY